MNNNSRINIKAKAKTMLFLSPSKKIESLIIMIKAKKANVNKSNVRFFVVFSSRVGSR